MPVYVYITKENFNLLTIMAFILLLPRPILALMSIVRSVGSIKAEMVAHRWDLLILTGIPARTIVWRKWLWVVRQTAFDHITCGLLHVGLALGVAQYMNVMIYPDPTTPRSMFLSPYIYEGMWPAQIQPSLTVFIIGCFVIVLFSLLECGLVAAIGIAAAFVSRRLSFASYLFGVLHYCTLLVVAYLLWICVLIGSAQANYYALFCPGGWQTITCNNVTWRDYKRVLNTLQMTIFTPIDQGTLLAANIMRPYDTRTLPNDTIDSMGNNISFFEMNYDNRPFVLRNIVAALLGAGIYAILIRAFLRRATRFAIINHGASGYLEL